MKLVTYRTNTHGPRSGLLLPGDKIADLQETYAACLRRGGTSNPDHQAAVLLPDLHQILLAGEPALSAAREADLFARRGEVTVVDARAVTFLPPILRPGKIIATGWNFASHIAETKEIVGAEIPPIATGFAKLNTALTGHDQAVVHPAQTQELDYEVEFAVVIGKTGRHIPAAAALEHVAGFTIMNDVTARDVQVFEMKAGLLLAGKNFDTFAPMGPCLATPDEVDLDTCELSMRINGEQRQKVLWRSAVRGVRELVAYWSSICTLEVGDIITGGSPPGVAMGGQYPYLKPGDVMEAEITGIGVLRNTVVAERGR